MQLPLHPPIVITIPFFKKNVSRMLNAIPSCDIFNLITFPGFFNFPFWAYFKYVGMTLCQPGVSAEVAEAPPLVKARLQAYDLKHRMKVTPIYTLGKYTGLSISALTCQLCTLCVYPLPVFNIKTNRKQLKTTILFYLSPTAENVCSCGDC